MQLVETVICEKYDSNRNPHNRANRIGECETYTEKITRYNKEIKKTQRNKFHEVLSRNRVNPIIPLCNLHSCFTESDENRAVLFNKIQFQEINLFLK